MPLAFTCGSALRRGGRQCRKPVEVYSSEIGFVDATRQLVSPSPAERDLGAAWQLVRDLYGFAFPDDYTGLVAVYGSGVWSRDLLLRGPHELVSTGAFYNIASERHSRDRFGHESAWPLWPEPQGAVAVGESGKGDSVFLLRHTASAEWTVGVVMHGEQPRELGVTFSQWMFGWLTGVHDLAGDQQLSDGVTDPTFAPWQPRIIAASLAPSREPLTDRVAAISDIVRDRRIAALQPGSPMNGLSLRELQTQPMLLSPLAYPDSQPHDPSESDRLQARLIERAQQGASLMDEIDWFSSDFWPSGTRYNQKSDTTPLRHASGDWQRLDFLLPGVEGADVAEAWYDDALDGSGNHRLSWLTYTDPSGPSLK